MERDQGPKKIPISFQRLDPPGAQRDTGRKHCGREESCGAQQACETLTRSLWWHSPLLVLPEPPDFRTNCRAGFFFCENVKTQSKLFEKHSASQIKHTNRTSMACRPWLWLLCNSPNTYPDPGTPRSWQEASPLPHTALPSYHRLGTQPSPELSPHSDDPHCVQTPDLSALSQPTDPWSLVTWHRLL